MIAALRRCGGHVGAQVRLPNCCWLIGAFVPFVASAQATNGIPPLRPAYPELPPAFWELHGFSILLLGGSLILLVAIGMWWWLRPKPKAAVPIEIQTRRELEALRARPEDGMVLSAISRALRRYLAVAFHLPLHELTTAEFCRAVAGTGELEPDLARAVCDFLRRCDELKFGPAQTAPPIAAAACALQIVERAEACRAHLREAAPIAAEPRLEQTS